MNRIFIGMGTCGLASGAEQVKDAVVKWIDEKKADVRITATGCIGYCQAEPIVDVVTEGGHRISYGEVKPENVRALLDQVFVRKDYGAAGMLGQYRNGSSGPTVHLAFNTPMPDPNLPFATSVKP